MWVYALAYGKKSTSLKNVLSPSVSNEVAGTQRSLSKMRFLSKNLAYRKNFSPLSEFMSKPKRS
jgi:hypothetical protein